METTTALLLTMLIPTLAMLANIVLRDNPNQRDAVTLAAAIGTFAAVLTILYNEGNGSTETFVLFEVISGLKIAFAVEPLGLLFALLASGLWIVSS